jgi:arginyl-tRNA synthetase
MELQILVGIIGTLVAASAGIISTLIGSKKANAKELNAFRKSIEEKLNMKFEKDVETLSENVDKIKNNHLVHIQNDITQLKVDFNDLKNQQATTNGKIDTIIDLLKK